MPSYYGTPQKPLRVALYPLRQLAWMGRTMMDFGFASYLDKFEKRFGPFLTSSLLVLIGLAIAAFCVNILVTHVLAPVVSLIIEWKDGDSFTSRRLYETVIAISTMLLFVLALVASRNLYDTFKYMRDKQRIAEEYQIYRTFVIEFARLATETRNDLSELLGEFEAATKTRTRYRLSQRAKTLIENRLERMASQITEVNRAIEDSVYFQERRKRRQARATGPGSEPQSPQDTGEKTQP